MSPFNSYLQILYSANARTSAGSVYKFESVEVRFGEILPRNLQRFPAKFQEVNGLVDEV